MTDTTFVDQQTIIQASWCNDVNNHIYKNTPIGPVNATHPALIGSISALRLLDKTKYTFATLSGYSSPGDTGGGVYYLDSSDTTSADTGGTIIVASDGGRWKRLDTSQYNTVDYATVGSSDQFSNGSFSGSPATGWVLSNFTSNNPGITHVAGTVGSATQSVVISPYTLYLISVTLTTTTQGGIAFTVNGLPVFDSGIYSVLPVVGSTTYQFVWFSSTDNASEAVQIFTDTSWAGQISAFNFYKVQKETEIHHATIPTDDQTLRDKQGLKIGRFNAGVLSLGDRQTAAIGGSAAVWNVAIGARALSTNQSGLENTAVGSFALQYNQSSQLTAYGYSALKYNTQGTENSAFGYKSLVLNSTGSKNTAVGYWSSFQNTTGSFNTSSGYESLFDNQTGSYLTAMGHQAGLNQNTGSSNTYIGALSGALNTSVALTYNYSNTTSLGAETKCYGSNNTAVGWAAKAGSDPNAGGATVTTAIAIGTQAVANASECVVIGDVATIPTATSIRSTVVGKQATGGGQNVVNVGFLTSTTDFSTAIGSQTGGNLTGTQNTSLGYGANNYGVASAFSNTTALGYQAVVTGSNQVQLGNAATTTYAYGAVQNRSDSRDKTDIRDTVLGLSFINSLHPVDFKWDMREFYIKAVEREDGTIEYIELPKNGSKKRTRYHHGLIAQEVRSVIESTGVDFGGFQDHSIAGGEDILSLGYEELIGPMIKAIQELKAEFDAYKLAHP